MLVEFSVENYLSFKERTTFSMLASKDMEHNDTNVITLDNGKRYLKTAVIYGANASGKSNLLKAMNYMTSFVRSSHQMQIGTPTGVVPFKLDTEYVNKPSTFDIIFYSEGIKYAYGFSVTNEAVIDEYLYYYPKGRQSLIFERSNVNQYRFTEDKETQNLLKDRNTENKLYLSTAANWNYEKVKSSYSWLMSFYLYDDNQESFSNLYDEKVFTIIKKWIKTVDFGIQDIVIKDYESGNEDYYKKISTVHVDRSKDGHTSESTFDMLEESDGTKRFFTLAAHLVRKIYFTGHNIMIDEMNAHFHTLLSKFIVDKYHSSENDYHNAQLIFTTHDTNLLDLNIFRRDQIWFTEKNPNTGATDLYSLCDFGVRKDVNVEKGYLLGRYGAIPFIGGNING